LGTWMLVPRLGIVGYGYADVAACAAYALLHVRLAQRVCLSYRRLAAWTSALLLPLFCGLPTNRWMVALFWTPLVWLAASEAAKWWKTRAHGERKIADRIAGDEESVALATGD